jgi:hypothetical protein
VFEADAMARLQFIRSPGDIGVDLLRARPGIEIDGLAPGLRLDQAPASSARAGERKGIAARRPAKLRRLSVVLMGFGFSVSGRTLRLPAGK